MTEAQLRKILKELPPGGTHEVHNEAALAGALGFKTMTKEARKKAQDIADEYDCMYFHPEFTRENPHFDKAYEDGHF